MCYLFCGSLKFTDHSTYVAKHWGKGKYIATTYTAIAQGMNT